MTDNTLYLFFLRNTSNLSGLLLLLLFIAISKLVTYPVALYLIKNSCTSKLKDVPYVREIVSGLNI